MDLFRQGDVLLIRADGPIPNGAMPVERDARGRVVLAEGETTGHCHAVLDADVELFATAEAVDRWLRVGQRGATLTHDEHASIALPPGAYLVRRQVEYRPEEIRAVAD